jgi:hypothetical protein
MYAHTTWTLLAIVMRLSVLIAIARTVPITFQFAQGRSRRYIPTGTRASAQHESHPEPLR